MLPVIYFHTKMLFLDDEKIFFDSLKHYLADLPYKAQHFLDSQELFKFLSKEDYYLDLGIFLNKQERDTEYEYNLQAKDIFHLHKIADNPKKDQVVSAIVIDYNLRGEKGLEVAAKLKDLGLEIILLTSHNDTHVAISAFNEGLINFYIQKQSPNFATELSNTLSKAEYNFFTNKSNGFFEAIKNLNPNTFLTNKDFQKLFNKLIQTNNITEYYLIDPIGSYLCKDNLNNSYVLFISQDIENRLLTEIAEIEEADQKLISLLKDHNNLMCYFNKSEYHLPDISEWSKYLKLSITTELNNQKCKYLFQKL